MKRLSTAERQNMIVEAVQKKGQIDILEICSWFNVSEMTARRDLSELDRQGLLRRVHGGAIRALGRSYEPIFRTRNIQNQDAKRLIGLKAASMINDGDSVAIDVGTTTLAIVPGLAGKHNLTILTSSLHIATAIVETASLEQNIRLILTGGIVRPSELSMVGPIPEHVYSELHVDKAFLGIAGISLQDGLTEYNIEDTEIKKVILSTAQQKILVADGSKFGVTTFAHVAPLTAIDQIITDSSAPAEILGQIRDLGIQVILAN